MDEQILLKRITVSPKIFGGKPIIRGRRLAVERQKEVLDFVESLEKKAAPELRRRILKGLWAGLGAQISPEDISEARREMWGEFPRTSANCLAKR